MRQHEGGRDAGLPTLAGKSGDQALLQQLLENRIGVRQETLDREEETCDFGDPSLLERVLQVGDEMSEEIFRRWRRVIRIDAAELPPLRLERRQRAGQCPLEK